MRLLTAEPGLSQQQLAARLRTAPSRIVSYVDDLAARGWLTRARDPGDRRINVLTLTAAGRGALASIAEISRAHDARFTAGLSDAEQAALRELLGRLAAARGMAPGVHPGYRRLEPSPGP
jgi:DNA-binding MarR family transcriptional regulator